MVGVRRDLCVSSSPTPLPKQGHLEQVAQDLVQAGLNISREGPSHRDKCDIKTLFQEVSELPCIAVSVL